MKFDYATLSLILAHLLVSNPNNAASLLASSSSQPALKSTGYQKHKQKTNWRNAPLEPRPRQDRAVAQARISTVVASAVQLQGNLTEQTRVLQRLYLVMGGAGWRRNSGWLQPGSSACDDWWGVNCTQRPSMAEPLVTELKLNSNRLVGSLANLSLDFTQALMGSLTNLDWSLNTISGAIE